MIDGAVLNQTIADLDTTLDVQLSGVCKVFDGDAAVRGIDLEVRRGEFFSILGPSGCGKTTLLRLIAGFEEPTAGDIVICGQGMTYIPAYRRPVNTVFQSYALFNHMTVWNNIAFGLRIKKIPKSETHERVQEALRLVKMETFASRYPAQLSGGQQQRVALARALANRPAVVLLDEPLAALDLKLRKEMQVELATLHQDLGITFILVTHDQEEALSLSNRIAVMQNGRIEQVDTPRAIYDYPKTPFVADFIGDTNLFHGRVLETTDSTLEVSTYSGLCLVLRSPHGSNASSHWNHGDRPNGNVVVSVRPEKIYLSQTPPEFYPNCFQAYLHTIMYLGTHVHCVLELSSGDRLKVTQPSASTNTLNPHTTVYVYWHEHDGLALAV
ncbi:MAG: ABC transporter ATP-binding protein [Cyanobacteria bacterium P01_E01_bin.6]